MSFDATRAWRRDRDVRRWDRLATALVEDSPNGLFRALVGARRSGKTWALRALEAQVEGACFLDLRTPRHQRRLDSPAETDRVLLIDEPMLTDLDGARALIDRVQRRVDEGRVVLIAMTPGEWSLSRGADPAGGSVAERDRCAIPALKPAEAAALAARPEQGWATALLGKLRADWQRNPFLLELLFETASGAAALRADPDALYTATVAAARHLRFAYVYHVLNQGLSPAQQALIREVCRQEAAPPPCDDLDLLVDCGLLAADGDRLRLADPVLADHLPPPLVVHHTSDIHFGRYSAGLVDGKAGGSAGARLAGQLGPALVADSYAERVEAGEVPHLILVSGDLAEWATAAELAAARAWLDRLRAAAEAHAHPDLREGEPRVLVVGGNHDVDWSKAAEADPRARHQAFAAALDGYPHPHLERPPEARGAAVVRYAHVGLEVGLLGSAELGGETERLDPELAALLVRLRDAAKLAFEAGDEARYDALLGAVDRIDPGLVAHADLRALSFHPWAEPVRLVVLHHPVSPVPGALEVKPYTGLLNAAEVKDALLRAGVRLVLHGHQHTGWVGRERWPELYPDRELLIASAPSLGSSQVGEKRGYNELRLRREGSARYELSLRRFVQRGGSWEPEGAVLRWEIAGSG